MAIRIIKVDRVTEDHWDYAKRNGFWDMPRRFKLEHGDTVLFWRSGSPARVLGQAKVVGEIFALRPSEPHAWSPGDHRQYRYRVPMADFHDLPKIDVRYKDFGLTGRPDVEYVPAHLADGLVRRLGVRIPVADLAFDQLTTAIASGAQEPYGCDEDRRARIPGSIVLRRGQSRFRRMLLDAYQGRCAITGTGIQGLLEAAHISPYRGDHTDRVQNGMLLRADIHTLFDLHLLAVLPDLTIRVAPNALAEPYASYDGTTMTPPARSDQRPDPAVLTAHSMACDWLGVLPDADGALF